MFAFLALFEMLHSAWFVGCSVLLCLCGCRFLACGEEPNFMGVHSDLLVIFGEGPAMFWLLAR